MPAASTAVIVDEWPLVRLGIAQALRTTGLRVAGEAGQGEEGLGKAAALDATFLVVGLVRDMPALEVVRRAAGRRQVVVLLDRPGREELAAVLSAGAVAVLVRSASPEEVADAVSRVAAGERVVAPMLLSLLVGALAPSDEDEPGVGGLTRKELEVLRRLAQGRSNREIAEALYITQSTVKTHLAHIYAKLGVTGRQEAVARALALGVLG